MSRRRNRGRVKAKWGEGKHRLARVQRFEAKHADSGKVKRAKARRKGGAIVPNASTSAGPL